MNRNEFYKTIEVEVLSKYNIGNSETVADVANAIGCIKEDDWVVYETDERAQKYIIERCSTEEEGLDIMLDELHRRKRKEEILGKKK